MANLVYKAQFHKLLSCIQKIFYSTCNEILLVVTPKGVFVVLKLQERCDFHLIMQSYVLNSKHVKTNLLIDC